MKASGYGDFRITGQELDFLLPDGVKKQSVNVILGAVNIVLGHKDVVHSVRYLLTEEECD